MELRHAVSAVGLVAALVLPATANTDRAYTMEDVNLRAGPHTEFPRVAMLPAGVPVTVYGCTYGWTWCDTEWRGLRGWVSGRYLEYAYEGRRVYLPDYGDILDLPTITFQFASYWERWYSDRPWYRERERWYSEWMEGDWEDRSGVRSRASVAVDLNSSSSIRSPSRDVPPGIAKKGRNFCPPGQAKKGRC